MEGEGGGQLDITQHPRTRPRLRGAPSGEGLHRHRGLPVILSGQVEDAVLDAYDQVYEQTVKSSSVIWRQELVAIQDMVSVVGEAPSLGSPGLVSLPRWAVI